MNASSRAVLETFFDTAPVPLGLPVGEVETRLGPADRVLERDGQPLGFEYDRLGFWIASENGLVTSISFLTGSVGGRGSKYAGVLPGGLSVDDPPGRAHELYGEPDRTQVIPLPRPPRAKLALSFYDLEGPATLTVAVRSDRPDRFERIVLARRKAI